MTALAQGTAGVALVMGFALLCIRQISTASILLAAQSIAVAITAVVLHQPLLAIPPVLLAVGVWFGAGHSTTLEPRMTPTGGAKSPGRNKRIVGEDACAPQRHGWRRPTIHGWRCLILAKFVDGGPTPTMTGGGDPAWTCSIYPAPGPKWMVGAGLTLAVLCQSQGGLALPLVVVLLSILLAAKRRHPVIQVMALAGLQNGVVLADCLVSHPDVPPLTLMPVSCFVLPLPLAAGLLFPILMRRGNKATGWNAGLDLGLSLAVFAATLLVPLDSTASVFAPLLGLDGVLRSCQRRNRAAMSAAGRSLALLNSVFLVLAVCVTSPLIAWLAVFAAIATALLPTLTRRWNAAVLALFGSGVALFGLLLVTLAPSVPGYFSVFAGFTAVATIVPDLAVVLVILLLRLADQAPWPPATEALGLAIALIALLICAAMVRGKSPQSSVTLLQQSQASIAALSICLGQADGRFAALVLLVLVILTRAATRVADGPVASLAIAGLGGISPLGVFPGLVLVVLAMTGHDAWLLLPLVAACVPILRASLPRRLPTFRPKRAILSVGWLPLGLALFSGYFAPEGLVRWWHVLTAGRG